MTPKQIKIIRVFPRKTNATPTDENVRINSLPGLFDDADEIHISVAFTWDIQRADYLFKAWNYVAPTKIGGPAIGTQGKNFEPGMYVKNGWKSTYHIELFRSEIQNQVKRLNERHANYRMAKKYGLIQEIEKPVKFYFETL